MVNSFEMPLGVFPAVYVSLQWARLLFLGASFLTFLVLLVPYLVKRDGYPVKTWNLVRSISNV